MNERIYKLLKFIFIFYCFLGIPGMFILFFFIDLGFDLSFAGFLYIFLTFLLALLTYYLIHRPTSEFWKNYVLVVFLFTVGGLLFWVILTFLNLPPLIYLLLFLFISFVLPYVFLKYIDLGMFFALFVLFLLLPGLPLIIIIGVPSFQPVTVLFTICIPISLILSALSFRKLKKVKPTKCPSCKNPIKKHYDEYNRRFFQCDSCGYYEYHLPSGFFGLFSKILTKVFCPYEKWKKNIDQPFSVFYYYEEDSYLRNAGGFYCAECGYRPDGPGDNCKVFRRSGGYYNSGRHGEVKQRADYCIRYRLTWNDGKRWNRCLNCKHLDYEIKDKRLRERLVDGTTGKIMDAVFGKDEDYLAYKRKREEIKRIPKKKDKDDN